MKNKALTFARQMIAASLLFAPAGALAPPRSATVRAMSDDSDVRGTVEQAFQQLKAGSYGSLYDVLPSASRRRLTRERFVRALERTRGMYDLERIEIGAVHVAGDLGVADSVIYGRARAPFAGEGKIVARQYLVREDGRWHITTGDRATVQPLLKTNPSFAKKYPLTEPRLYLKRDGRWADVSRELQGLRRRATK